MAESFITQCPHCGTSFRVRTEQLAVANGSVRCGACLQVFSARNHVVTTSIPSQTAGKAAPVAKRTAPKPAIPKPTAPKSPVPRPTAKPAVKPRPNPAPMRKAPPKQDTSRFPTDTDDDAEFLFAADDDDDEFLFAADSDDDELFDEDEQNDGLGELSDSFLNLNNSNPPQKKVDHFQSETHSLNKELFAEDEDDEDESWAESMLEEIEKENVSLKKPAVFESRNVSTKQSQSEAHNAAMKRSALFVDLESGNTQRPTSASQVVNQASQELDLDFHFEERLSRLRPLGWLVVALFIVILFAQFAWLQRDTYARMDQWRGLYAQACDVIGCELPDQVDVEQIRTSVIVRDHKNTALKDIKMVDIVLTNRAPFKQPFPEILLQYSDVNGKVVADQSFLPTDYLKGEMTGVMTMPLNTRVYVSIPIKAPAKSAVNYQLILNPISQ
ncbi:DUF3426 domain-containing protein [Reinekea sp.]|jgi:predicted Zn finger-like uncharacterized protein|uniref:DUF3426 domain-containing protein n=1 Tax=Reinekea sp. TaxID=1970455 RepID=UPI0039897E49